MWFINWLVIIVLFVFWLAEDEIGERGIQEGEFRMAVSGEWIGNEGSGIEVESDGSVIISTIERGEVRLTADEAYHLLDVLYQHIDSIRQKEQTVPLPGPVYDGHVGESISESFYGYRP